MNVIDDMLRSSPLHEEIKEPIEQSQEAPEPIFEQREEIQEDQIVPESGETGENEKESTVEATTATELTVEQDFKRKTWNFDHFGTDENRNGFNLFICSSKFYNKKPQKVVFLAAKMVLFKTRSALR